MTSPCKDCTDRHDGCHGKCERYQAFRTEIEERKPNNYADYDYRRYVSGVKWKIALRRVHNRRHGKQED